MDKSKERFRLESVSANWLFFTLVFDRHPLRLKRTLTYGSLIGKPSRLPLKKT